jgi:hypothetical protein
MSKNLNNLNKIKPPSVLKTSGVVGKTNKITNISSNTEKSFGKMRSVGLFKKKQNAEDSLENDSFIGGDKGEGQIKPIMEKMIHSTLRPSKKTSSIFATEKPVKKSIKINLVTNTTSMTTVMQTPKKDTSPKASIRDMILKNPINNVMFTEANKFRNSNHKERSIVIVEKVNFSNFLKLYNTKVNNMYLVLQYLSHSEVRALFRSFRKMKILVENSLTEWASPMLKGFTVLRDHLQLIKRKLVFYKYRGNNVI